MANFTRNARASAAVLAAIFFVGCVNEDGHFRPPDPLGRAIFDLFDPPGRNRAPYNGSRDADYVYGPPNQPPPNNARNPEWVEGAWGWSNGNRVWVPGHWAQDARQVAPY